MSAFQVSPTHIGALVRWYLKDCPSHARGSWRHHSAGCTDAEDMINVLALENYRSVAYRYEPRHTIDKPDAVTHVTLSSYPKLEPIAVIKACDCLDYQSCEHPEWETSDAYHLLNAIRHAAISRIHGYDDAAWEIQ